MTTLCCPTSALAQLSRAAAKAISARLRRMGTLAIHPRWEKRAAICERCPQRIIHADASYCGRPFLQHFPRDPVADGCGCPTISKAKDPHEHCPLDTRHAPAQRSDSHCTCKWCS